MKNLPLIAGTCGLLLLAVGLLGVFIEKISKDDGALLIAGAILMSAALLCLQKPAS
jgi:membrane-bound ClpP family serine protease